MQFASFFSSGSINAKVVNPPERRLAKRNCVQLLRSARTKYKWPTCWRTIQSWSAAMFYGTFHSSLYPMLFFRPKPAMLGTDPTPAWYSICFKNKNGHRAATPTKAPKARALPKFWVSYKKKLVKKFGVEYWALSGSNLPWRPWDTWNHKLIPMIPRAGLPFDWLLKN